MSVLETLWLFSAPIGGLIIGVLVYFDGRRDAKRLNEFLARKR